MRNYSREVYRVRLGYAAGEDGEGVVYARVGSSAGERLVRAAFRIARYAGTDGREISYGALTAVATLLRERGVERVEFSLPDRELVGDLVTHRPVPPPLILPYVTARCALNRFSRFTLSNADEESDLVQRARAEIALHTAA